MSKLEVTIEEQADKTALVFFMKKQIGKFDTVEEAKHAYSFAKFLSTPIVKEEVETTV